MRAREGNLVETDEHLIFDVKGLVHPPRRIIAFIRYFPDEKGERKKNGVFYGKVYSLQKRYALLKEKFPQYLVYDPVFDEVLCEVPVDSVKKHYDPIQRLEEIRSCDNPDALEKLALCLAETLTNAANISWDSIGVSGSILARLHIPNSDIDPVVYGSENCLKAYNALKRMLESENSGFKRYTIQELKILFDFRSKDTAMGFEDFVTIESGKVLQGKFLGTDYFVRFVKDWNEIDEEYGDVQYKNVGYAKIKATIVDDSETIFTPCIYRVRDVTVVEGTSCSPVSEISSFRGRFCEQAKAGEIVVAQGKVEYVLNIKKNREHYRLLLGNKPSDYMIPKR